MARKLKKKLPKAQFGLIDDVTKLGRKYLPKIFPKPIPPSVLSPMKTFKVGKNPALTFDDWRSYVETGNVQPAFQPFFSQKAGQHILPTFAPVDEFGTVGLTGDLVRKESNRFNNLVFDRGLMIAPAQGTGRKSVHFTGTGKPVPSHLMGNWDHVTNTFTLPMADAIRYNAMPRSTAPNDVYFYSPRQFVYPPSTKILTGDMELASNARGIGLDVNFNKELFKLNKQLNKIEELKNTPGTKYSYNESTSSGNFNSDKYNLYKKDREPLVRQVKSLTDDWLTGLNLQGIDHLNPAYKLGFRDFDPNLRNDLLRNIRSSSESPYVHSESPEFKYYMEGLKDSSGLPLVKSRSQRIDENPSLIFDDVTMEQAKDPKYSLFDNAKIYKGGYEKAGMVEPSQADLILYQKQIFSYPKEYVEKILANYDAKNFPKDGPYRKILENYIKDGSAGVKYDEGGETDENTLAYSRLLKRFIPSAAVLGKNPLLTFAGAMLYPNTLGEGSTLETPSLEQQYQNYLNFTTPEERIKNELEYEVMTGKPFTFDPQPLPNQQSGGELLKAQSGLNLVKEAGKYFPSLKSIKNPFGRLNFKFNPYPVIPRSQLLIPGRTYSDVQHKIPSLIRENQRTDTPGIASFIMPRGNLDRGKVFATEMTDRIQTFLPEGQMLNKPFKLMDGNTRFWLGEQMGKNWDDEYRIIQSSNKSLFPEIGKFDLKLSKRPDGSLAWFKPDGTEYTDLVDTTKPFPSLIGTDKTSPATLLQGPRLIKNRPDLENQFNIRNTAYHTVNITDGLRNNEIIRSQAKKYGYNPDDDRELAMFLGTSPGGSGRRGGYSIPKGYDILFSGNNPVTTLERYGNLRTTPFTVQFDLMDPMAPRLLNQKGKTFGAYPQLNAPGNKMPIVAPGFNETDLGLYDRISAFDTKNSNFPQFGIASPFSYNTQLGMSTFKKGLNPDDYQGLIINPNSLQVPGLTQTNLIFGKENVPVRMPTNIYTPDEVFKMRKEYGGQTPGLALDDTPDRTYKDGGAVRTSLSEYEDGGEPNYNQMLIKFIKDQEAGMEYMKAKNSAVMKPDGSGYYKRYEDGKFYPYYHQNSDGTFEKEATIAYGTKGADIFDLYKEGISVPEAEEQLNKSLNNAHRKTKIYVDANYGEGFYDNLTDQKKTMLADFTYNLGRLSKYPKFAEGILTDNTDLALAEYIRGEQEGGAKLARNEAYLETFLQPWVDQTLERKKKEEEEEKLRLLNQKRDNIMEEKYSSWYSPFVPNSIENLFKQNYDWEDQYWKDKGITTYQDGGEDGKKYVSPYEKYGGIDEYSKMLKFLSYQQALKSGNKTMSDFYDEMYGFGDMSFDDMYGQARKIYEIGLNNPDDYISQRLIGRMVDSEGRPQFQYKGQPYNPYSYTEVASDKYRQLQNEIASRVEGILSYPYMQNSSYTRTINPTTGKYEYEPVTVPTGPDGRFPVGEQKPITLSEDVFRNEGDLQKYIDEQFPEGSKERAFIDANPDVKKNWENLVAAYEHQRPHIVHANQPQLFEHIFDPESNEYINNFAGDNKRYIELQQKRCAEIKQKFPTYNCDTGEIEGTDRNKSVIKADNRSDYQRERDRKYWDAVEYNKKNKIPPNMMFMVHSSPGLSSMYNQAQRTGDYSAINQQVMNFSPSNPENLALGATTIAGGPILRGIGNIFKTPLGKFVPKVFNPNVARPVTVGDAINVGFGAYGTAKHGPSMVSNLMEGEYGDAAKDLGNLALYNIGVPSSLGAFNRGMNFGKVFPGQFTKSVVPQRNITPSTLDAFKTKYPNLNPSLSPQQYEGFAAFSQQLPNYSLINPIRTRFPGTQRFIGQPKLTQSLFDNVFKNMNQGATIVK